MHPHHAYQQHQQPVMLRIDLIIALYRKAMDRLERAERMLAEQRPAMARTLLAEVQWVVSSLAAGSAGGTDDPGAHFMRLYEFVLHKLHTGASDDIVAVRRVLTPLLEGFLAVRDQAAGLERLGQIPSLDRQREVQLTV